MDTHFEGGTNEDPSRHGDGPSPSLGLAACGESSTSSDSAICDAGPCEILGTFALQSIDGEALPAVVSALTDPIFVEVTEGSVTFNDDTTCFLGSTKSETMTDGTATIRTESEQCVYAFDLNNQTFTMTFPLTLLLMAQ